MYGDYSKRASNRKYKDGSNVAKNAIFKQNIEIPSCNVTWSYGLLAVF